MRHAPAAAIVTEVEPPHKSAQEVLAHPRFAEARRAHIEQFVAIFSGDAFMTRLLSDSARLMLASLLVGMYAAHDPDDPATWATPGRVQEIVAGTGVASPRHVEDIIARLLQTQFVEVVKSVRDKRIHILTPTEELLAYDREYVAALHHFLHVLYPDRGYAAVIAQDSRIHLAIRKAGFAVFPRATAFLSRHPAMMTFLSHDAGYMAFLLIARSELLGSDAHHGPSYIDIADRLGVSRTHVRKLLAEAEAAGYVTVGAKGGRGVKILPPMWDAFNEFLADMESGHDAIAQTAFRALREEAQTCGAE